MRGREFAARTPYYYSSWGTRLPWARLPTPRSTGGDRPSVVILGSGPNRIGQGIEFDLLLRPCQWQTVREQGERRGHDQLATPRSASRPTMTPLNRLYFEPLTLEDVLAVCGQERPAGVIVQFGGQTPLKLAAGLKQAGVPILGTTVDVIDLAEDRSRFGPLLDELGYKAPPYATATSPDEALEKAPDVGFPLLVRPSYVLGGRAMEIVYSSRRPRRLSAPGRAALTRPSTWTGSSRTRSEVDVDALSDGADVWIAGIMQHVEEAGIHSGDSACVRPAAHARHRDARRDPGPDRGDRAGARSRRAAQRAVCDSRGHAAVRDRGQSAKGP